MLTVELLGLGADEDSDDSEYTKIAKKCFKSEGMDAGRLAECATRAAAAGACAAAAASTGAGASIATGAGAVCAMGAGYVIEWVQGAWDWLSGGPTCADMGGTLWCRKPGIGYVMAGTNGTLKIACQKNYMGTGNVGPVGCCADQYCQLPGMLAPGEGPTVGQSILAPVIIGGKRLLPGRPSVRDADIPTSAREKYWPKGTIATQDKTSRKWCLGVPTGLGPSGQLAGAGDYLVIEVTTNPTQQGAEAVSKWRFEYLVGKRSWYETPPAWIALGLLGVAGIAYWRYGRNWHPGSRK